MVAPQNTFTIDEPVGERQSGQRKTKIIAKPVALAAKLKNASPTRTDKKSFSTHFEDLVASWVVSAIINVMNSIVFFCLKKLIELCILNGKLAVRTSFFLLTQYKENLEGKSVYRGECQADVCTGVDCGIIILLKMVLMSDDLLPPSFRKDNQLKHPCFQRCCG